jgi:3-oxoacyl-[acyl-carrier protein] reductase
MDLGISGKTALVTGGSRGIGRAICLELADNGVNIVAVARSEGDLDSLSQEIGQRVNFTPLTLDLSVRSNLKQLFLAVQKQNIEVNIIVNNLGGNLNLTEPLGSYDEFESVFYLNFGVAVEINRFFIPKMRQNGWGRICHISSISALENQGPPQYCSAKAALNAYVRSVGRFLSKDNIIVNGVMPGAIKAKGNYWDEATINRPEYVENYLRSRLAINRFGTLDEVTKVVAFLVSDLASFMVGSMVLVDGGQGRSFEHVSN